MKLKTLGLWSLIALAASLSLAAHAQTFSVIHAFSGVNGAIPYSGVTIRAGILYGTTYCTQYCGGAGTVYQITHVGSNWVHTPISVFSAGGLHPRAGVRFGPDNHLYGTTQLGGPQSNGNFFNLTPPTSICRTANCFWNENVLYNFRGRPDGQLPRSDFVWDPMGNIYGTTQIGGTSNLGTVFQMTKSGNNWTEMPIYSFTGLGSDGSTPVAGVILDPDGNLFGTTALGGSYGYGMVFELTYHKGLGWTEIPVYSFQSGPDGQDPYAGLVRDATGNLYGSTSDGGGGGGGTVFELTPSGDTYTFHLLYSFSNPFTAACGPEASLTMDGSGNLYGTTYCNGENYFGNVFKLTNTQNGWEYTSLYDFSGSNDGANPASDVTFDTDGRLYGTAAAGGTFNSACPVGCGTVWMIEQ